MFRQSLFTVDILDSKRIGSYQSEAIPVLDIRELAAGKLTALFSRHASRDLFDTYLLLRQCEFDNDKLRLAFVVYGAMNRKDWCTVSLEDVDFDRKELENQLIPVLSEGMVAGISR